MYFINFQICVTPSFKGSRNQAKNPKVEELPQAHGAVAAGWGAVPGGELRFAE